MRAGLWQLCSAASSSHTHIRQHIRRGRLMIRSFRIADGGLAPVENPQGASWIDLVEPSDTERKQISALIGVRVPSRADQDEIEHSSRLYLDHGAPVMTVLLPVRHDGAKEVMAPVTFILLDTQLVTFRDHAQLPFETYPERAADVLRGSSSVERLTLGLLAEIVERLADITEHVGREIDLLSHQVFRPGASVDQDLPKMLRSIGRFDTAVMHLRESLLTLERMLGFLAPVIEARKPELRSLTETALRDVKTIVEQTDFLSQKTSLLLSATLGLINVEQNSIIKVLSVAAVVFLPPTLIASIYGMNFVNMPELSWPFSYPVALVAMLVSAVLPLVYFRWRGWF